MSRNIALTLEGDEAVIVSGVAQLLHQVLGLLLGQLLTEVHQQLEQLELQDGVVGIFVVQLQDLNEVVEATLVLGVLAGLVHGEDIGLGEELLSLGDSTTDLLDGLQGWVEVAGTDKVANIEGVNLAISLEVIDVKGEVDGWKAWELGRWWCVGGLHSWEGKGGGRELGGRRCPHALPQVAVAKITFKGPLPSKGKRFKQMT